MNPASEITYEDLLGDEVTTGILARLGCSSDIEEKLEDPESLTSHISTRFPGYARPSVFSSARAEGYTVGDYSGQAGPGRHGDIDSLAKSMSEFHLQPEHPPAYTGYSKPGHARRNVQPGHIPMGRLMGAWPPVVSMSHDPRFQAGPGSFNYYAPPGAYGAQHTRYPHSHDARASGYRGQARPMMHHDARRPVFWRPGPASIDYRHMTVHSVLGSLAVLAQEPHGSRFLQNKIQSCSPEEREIMFNELEPHTYSLMGDVYGNYVVQRFLEHGSDSQRCTIAARAEGRILPLVLQMHGCRVVQRMLDCVDAVTRMKIMREMEGHVVSIVLDQNGNHVIQRAIKTMNPAAIAFVLDDIATDVIAVSTNPYGCRVMQTVLEHCSHTRGIVPLLAAVVRCTGSLAQDQYGNYVIQHFLHNAHRHVDPGHRAELFLRILEMILPFSQHKYASNVVETCLRYCSPQEMRSLVTTVCQADGEGTRPLEVMMKDPYANYVVQRLLDACDSEQRAGIFAIVTSQAQHLKKYTYGRHIVARIEEGGL